MELICPKCHGLMRQYERNGVTVDQCGDCRGIFLDRGELERLTEAENGWHQQHSGYRPEPRYEQHYDDRRHHEHRPEHGHQRKRRSFLEDLFD